MANDRHMSVVRNNSKAVCEVVHHETGKLVIKERDNVTFIVNGGKSLNLVKFETLSTPFCEVRAKKPSLTLNLGTNGLKVTSEPPPMAGQAGHLQGQDRSAVNYPSSGHARRSLIWLSCDNRRTRYTAP
ncbi:hypothetical protein J6590_034999, partial [Homalodisca vitripennis]